MKTFDIGRNDAEPSGEAIPFQLAGDTFVYHVKPLKMGAYRRMLATLAGVQTLADRAEHVSVSEMLAIVEAPLALVNALLVDDSKIHLQQRLDDPADPLDVDDLVDLIPKLIAEISERPTQSSPGS